VMGQTYSPNGYKECIQNIGGEMYWKMTNWRTKEMGDGWNWLRIMSSGGLWHYSVKHNRSASI